MLKVQLVTALGLLALATVVSGECGCLLSGVACINETSFDVCINGTKSGLMLGSCTSGLVCTAGTEICQAPSDTVLPDCPTKCKKCTGNFACVSRTEFALCTNGSLTDNIISCPPNKVCDIDRSEICGGCESEPTCSNDVVEKPDPAKDYAETCNGKNETENGYYKNIYDSTCETYVYCEKLGDDMFAILYNCKDSYFDASAEKCVSQKPEDCS